MSLYNMAHRPKVTGAAKLKLNSVLSSSSTLKMGIRETILNVLTLTLFVCGPKICWAWAGNDPVAIDDLPLAQVPQAFRNGPLVPSSPSAPARDFNSSAPRSRSFRPIFRILSALPKTDDIIKIMNTTAITWDDIWKVYSEVPDEEKVNATYINSVFWEELLKKILPVHTEIREMDRMILSERKPLALMDAIFEIDSIEQLADLKKKKSLSDKEHLIVTYFQLSSASSQYHRLYTKRIRDILTDEHRVGLVADSINAYRNYIWKGDKLENITIHKTTDLTDLHMLYGPKKKNIWIGIKSLLDENPEIYTKAQFEENRICVNKSETFPIEPAGQEGPYYVLFHLCLADIKEYMLISFAKLYGQIFRGQIFTQQEELKERMFRRCNRKVQLFEDAFGRNNSNSSYLGHPGVAKCDPPTWEYGVNYIKLTNFVKVFVAPEESLHKSGSCRSTCSVLDNTYEPCPEHDPVCNTIEERECDKQPDKCKDYDPVCPTGHLYCENGTNIVTVCPSQRHDRLYEGYYGEGFANGNLSACKGNEITYTGHWELEEDALGSTPHYCEVCTCYCFEPMTKLLGNSSVRWFHPKLMRSDFRNNYIVVGARFVQIDDTIGIAIAEAKATPRGKFDPETIRWKFPPKLTEQDREQYPNFRVYQDMRTFNLDDVVTNKLNRVVTGIQFYQGDYLGSFEYRYIGVQIVTHEVDNKNGQLRTYRTEEEIAENKRGNSKYTKDGATGHKNDNSTVSRNRRSFPEEPFGPDDPIRAPKKNTPNSRTNDFIVFLGTSVHKDAAQSTVPYFDAQELLMPKTNPHALKGIGVFHKTVKGYGGFLALKLIPHQNID